MPRECPRVTLIVNSYNQLSFIDQAVQSVVNQTYPNLEIIVLDDASTDGSADYVRDLPKRFSSAKIRTVINPTRIGAFKSVNLCLKKASGAYVAFISSDDAIYPDFAEVLADLLNNGADIAYSQVEHWSEDFTSFDELGQKIVYPYHFEKFCCGLGNHPNSGVRSDWRRWGISTSVMFRKSVFEQFGYFDYFIHSYFAIFSKLGRQFLNIVGTEKPLYKHRAHDSDTRKIDNHNPENKQASSQRNLALFQSNRLWLIEQLPLLSKSKILRLFPELAVNKIVYHRELCRIFFNQFQLKLARFHFEKSRSSWVFDPKDVWLFKTEDIPKNFFLVEAHLSRIDAKLYQAIALVFYNQFYPERITEARTQAVIGLSQFGVEHPAYCAEIPLILNFVNKGIFPGMLRDIPEPSNTKGLKIKSTLIESVFRRLLKQAEMAIDK